MVLDYALRRAIEEHKDLGFTLTPRRSRRHPAVKLSDLDFADDIGLLSDQIQQAQELLTKVELQCQKVGLHLNAKKTEYMALNIGDHVPLKTTDGTPLEQKPDFKYLGSWVNDSSTDIATRKAKAWTALHNMKKIWTSALSRKLKLRYFTATVESILLYGCESWSLTSATSKSLDGCYTRMLRMALQVSWREHQTNEELYAGMPLLSTKMRERRLGLAGHCYRHQDLPASKLLLWQPTHGKLGRGRPKTTFVDTLKADTGATSTGELASCMEDRARWRDRFRTRPTGRRK